MWSGWKIAWASLGTEEMQSGFIKAGLWVSLALLNMIVIHFHF
jgi:hypothetical protein